nr:MAG TPA: hypothetical protein [Caudoviricetes sp.]
MVPFRLYLQSYLSRHVILFVPVIFIFFRLLIQPSSVYAIFFEVFIEPPKHSTQAGIYL